MSSGCRSTSKLQNYSFKGSAAPSKIGDNPCPQSDLPPTSSTSILIGFSFSFLALLQVKMASRYLLTVSQTSQESASSSRHMDGSSAKFPDSLSQLFYKDFEKYVGEVGTLGYEKLLRCPGELTES